MVGGKPGRGKDETARRERERKREREEVRLTQREKLAGDERASKWGISAKSK